MSSNARQLHGPSRIRRQSLLADEPTGNLDTENSERVLSLIKDLNQRLGQTVAMITHNPEAAAYSHRIVRMKDGVILDQAA